ncbi:hypothetical protein BS50DRAFT_529203 [Corynespora cassiicola Philippines]|uniref:BTB domain-containing protein n=1 Tax=Corynespora cassiicola Philippines TaxID=1448308 RepID=A0A2T2NH20_CORCC|nr:hypothetical protein BS50DRAFT_529203 [Corynespora cassiicola Philippines]
MSQLSICVTASSTTSFLQTPAIKIIVGDGDDQSEFFVHQGIICDRSEFFRRALNGNWAESTDRVVRLPEDNPSIFSLYHGFLYTKSLPILPERISNDEKESEAIAEQYLALCELYVLAEKLVDSMFKADVLDALKNRSTRPASNGACYYPNMDCVRVIYDGTRSKSKARSLLVSIYVDHGNEEFVKEEVDQIPKEFLHDLCRKTLQKRQRPKDIAAKLKNKDDEIERLKKIVSTRITAVDRMIQNNDSRLQLTALDTNHGIRNTDEVYFVSFGPVVSRNSNAR